ncbi:uncharacterized protein PAC_18061 [Phialocephala subalpina]|uniref:SH3 domain-containing protein n=1 Tax=Phialocephala subalpina TaxID=576137 RepID=A0A1L7XT13_9HELO|nr:uncharacterized protein PAC_18061 [Phialocephala subalpina]
MSFGWSAGDIIATLKLLHQIGSALKDSGGASSEYQDTQSFFKCLSGTLQLLHGLQSTPIDPYLALNLREQCDHIRVPLQAFLGDVGKRFEPALGSDSKRKAIFASPRKIQWALSDSKKVKTLQARLAVPMAAVGILLGRQTVQTTLRLPDDIRDRISRVIDTRTARTTALLRQLDDKMDLLSTSRTTSTDTLNQHLQDLKISTSGDIATVAIEHREGIGKLADNLGQVLNAQRDCIKANTNIRETLKDLSVAHSASTDLVLGTLCRTGENAATAVRVQALEGRAQSASLHRKLDQVGTSVGAIQSLLEGLSATQLSSDTYMSKSEAIRALRNILKSVWLLLSSIHALIRELVYVWYPQVELRLTYIRLLLAPYLIVFHRNLIQPLLMGGDHFLFEDAIGRMKRLPCMQFQHWDIFYTFLLDSFRDSPGLSWVISERFMVMNRYNNYPINRKLWRALIQPNYKVAMSMLLDFKNIRHGRCADPGCPGRIKFETAEDVCVCPKCGKHLLVLKESHDLPTETFNQSPSEALGSTIDTSSMFGLESESLNVDGSVFPRASSSQEIEIAAFKRVTWEERKLQWIDLSFTTSIKNGKKEGEHGNISARGLEIPSSAPQPPMYVRALYGYEADLQTELSFRRGDVVQVITQPERGWGDGIINGVRGWFPSNFCQVITDPEEVLEAQLNGFKGAADFWVPQATPDGRLFYFNTETGESRRDSERSEWTVRLAADQQFGTAKAMMSPSTQPDVQPRRACARRLCTREAWEDAPFFTARISLLTL